MQLSLTTPFGPATFTLSYDDYGRLIFLDSSVGKLSRVMRKLTYGERSESAGKYFVALENNMRYSCALIPFLGGIPDPYDRVVPPGRSAKEHDPELPPVVGWARQFWSKYPKLYEALFFRPDSIDRGLQRMAANYKNWSNQPPEQITVLYPWVITLFDLVEPGTIRLVWIVLGRLQLATGADYMLSELERPGIHPEGKHILEALSFSFDADRDGQRLLSLGQRKEYTGPLAGAYLELVSRAPGQQSVDTAKEILFQQVDAAPQALKVFRASGVNNPVEILLEAFRATELFWVVFRYVELLQELAPDEQRIDLTTLNKKLAARVFTDTAPVTWQQQLSDAWKDLLDRTPADECMAIIETYIVKREARLLYNALLQLNYLIRKHPGIVPDRRILRRLHQLVSHRYDKVVAQALAAIRKLIDHMPDRIGLNQQLMPISTAPGLRVAKLKILKTLGEDRHVAAAQREYFRRYVDGDLNPDQLMVAKSIIKYLKLDARGTL